MAHYIIPIARGGKTITERHREQVRACITMSRISDYVTEKNDTVKYGRNSINIENRRDWPEVVQLSNGRTGINRNYVHIAKFKDKENTTCIALVGRDYSIIKAKNCLDEILRG